MEDILAILDDPEFISTSGSMESWNNSTEETRSAPTNNDITLMVFRLMVCGFGLIGNLVVIFVILVLREYKKAVTHWYVLQLAFADSLFLLTLPFKILEDIHNEWIFSGGMCKAKETILFLNYYSSILFLTIMSIDRYIAVCQGFSSRLQKLRTKHAAYGIAFGVWVISLILCTPVMLYSDKMGFDPNCICAYEFPNEEEVCIIDHYETEEEYQECLVIAGSSADVDKCQSLTSDPHELEALRGALLELFKSNATANATSEKHISVDGYEVGCSYMKDGPGWKAFLSFNFVVMFALPFAIMSVCYSLIILRLKKASVRRGSLVASETDCSSTASTNSRKKKRTKSVASKKAEKNRNRVTAVCGALVILFLICWLPFHSVHLTKMTGIKGKSEYCMKISAVVSLIAYLNSALNPYVYNFIGTKFWRRLRSATGTFRNSVNATTSGSGFVQYHSRKHKYGGGSTSNTGTVAIKIYTGKSEVRSVAEVSSANDVFDEDTKQGNEMQPFVQ